MDLSIITVTWNNEKEIARQIASVFAGCKDVTCEEIIVDSGSSDQTIEIVKNQFPHVKLIENKENIGFGAGNNQGLKIAQGEFLLFLNGDMMVEEGSLDGILDWMKKNKDVGIVCPKLLDQYGKFNWDASPRRFPKLWEQLALILKIPHIFPNTLNSYHMKDLDIEKEQEVDSVRGSFMLMRREFVDKLGWAFDPRYFIWYEDVDICREAKRLNYKVMYTPVISAIDYVGQSFKKRKTLWKQKQFTRSMLTYFKKWEPMYKWIWIAILRPFGVGLAWVNDLFKK
ncbi:MAG: glycosyltransferase family 2 protein [Candidatus Magasanikbacteria bacterium]|jgi:GT2 family glycosyltransferase|nr:glycosyltransferase family 2 protein [Candidatus Magasanikbacteria bacterium]MBT4314945.1 glycosyltransferase family 2 protein [Candidatus Magasanikbacteria bacterium]MBT4546901.1 glycosyltransferase family 2 protein [Candidatus Magasanikbacteria bacterium]MBT6819185.1 glycosyltransferase family 2 protein [Candidatus Magasanikbacteria bacterium]